MIANITLLTNHRGWLKKCTSWEDPLDPSSRIEISLSGVYPLWSIWGTLPGTKIAPENDPLEEEIHLYKPSLGFHASFLGCTTVF